MFEKSAKFIGLGVAAGSLAFLGSVAPVQAAGLDLGKAAQFGILALDNGTSNKMLTINSSTSITGNVGISQGFTVDTLQKVKTWNGDLVVDSGVTMNEQISMLAPLDSGVQKVYGGPTAPNNVQTSPNFQSVNYQGLPTNDYLDGANADALMTASFLSGQTYTNQGSINDNSFTYNSNAQFNYIEFSSVNANSDTLTLNSRTGQMDWFIIKVSGSFDWSQSTVALGAGTKASRILWYVPGDNKFLINKDSTVWNGTILAPNRVNEVIEYHNPATFNGAIIANKIDVHSDFNLNQVPFEPIPEPLTILGAGTAAGFGAFFKRQVAKKKKDEKEPTQV